MLEFPFVALPGGVERPIIPVILEGAAGRRLLDGLLHTGADRTLFPEREAKAVGLRLPAMPDGHAERPVASRFPIVSRMRSSS